MALVVDLASGLASGVAVTLVGHPFETLKVRLQTQPSPPNHVYDGLVDCVKKTLAWEGPAGLYKGVSAPLVGQLFFRSAMFQTNGAYLRWMSGGGTQSVSYVAYGLGGALTWGVATAIEAPLQTVASQMQVAILRAKADPGAKPEFSGVRDYVATAPGKYGVARAFYSGLGPHLARNTFGGFFHFGAFETIRREVARRRGVAVTDVGLGVNMAAGSVGGVLFWSLTYPLDVLKSALQGDNFAAPRYNGTLDAARKLWAEGGAARFTRGFSACLARSVPANAVLLTTAFRVKEIGYEYMGLTNKVAAPAPSTQAAGAGKAVAAKAA